jgi:hypothetical protein
MGYLVMLGLNRGRQDDSKFLRNLNELENSFRRAQVIILVVFLMRLFFLIIRRLDDR